MKFIHFFTAIACILASVNAAPSTDSLETAINAHRKAWKTHPAYTDANQEILYVYTAGEPPYLWQDIDTFAIRSLLLEGLLRKQIIRVKDSGFHDRDMKRSLGRLVSSYRGAMAYLMKKKGNNAALKTSACASFPNDEGVFLYVSKTQFVPGKVGEECDMVRVTADELEDAFVQQYASILGFKAAY